MLLHLRAPGLPRPAEAPASVQVLLGEDVAMGFHYGMVCAVVVLGTC